jgi:hypothetical protein
LVLVGFGGEFEARLLDYVLLEVGGKFDDDLLRNAVV